MFKRIFKSLLALLLVFIMILIVMVNAALDHKPQVAIVEGNTVQIEVLKELRGLKSALDRKADLEMQNVYPEGYVFLNAIYALAWAAFLNREEHIKYFHEGHGEIYKAWMRIDSPTGKASFNEDLLPPYGSFYSGWSSYVLASKLRIEEAGTRSNREMDQLKHQCSQIADAIGQNVYPPSYPGGTWPADVTVCVATLCIHDKIFEPRYKDVIEKWLLEVKKRLDPGGMIPHSVNPSNGSVQENARGSSMALTLVFLYEIERKFAEEQFSLFKRNFVDTRFGLTGLREYSRGQSGKGDIDSGPVILGLGGAATIVGMQTLSLFGEQELSLKVRGAIESVTFPFQTENEKNYLFGELPMADAFMVWSHSRMARNEQEISFIQFHLNSLFIFTLLSIFFWILISSFKTSPR